MHEELNKRVEIVKCPCGHESCRYYGLNVGTFYQGNGWDKELAEFIRDAINEKTAREDQQCQD